MRAVAGPARAFGAIVRYLIGPGPRPSAPLVPPGLFDHPGSESDEAVHRKLNAAWLVMLAGNGSPEWEEAQRFVSALASSPEWGAHATFCLDAVRRVSVELDGRCRQDAAFAAACERAGADLAGGAAGRDAAEMIWPVLFPEAAGIRGDEVRRVSELRGRRTVAVRQANPLPIRDPAREVLFTSNVLLTTPLADADLSSFDAGFQDRVACAAAERQVYWYDHPIPVGVSAESNEILYGLRHLDEAVGAERRRSPVAAGPLTCVLSVSVTHRGLHVVGKPYLEQVLAAAPPLDNLRVFAFTEDDCQAIVRRVLLPAAERRRPSGDAEGLLSVFGVDGRYGRHYSFLKAIAALWNVLVDPGVRATFKIDLDQVFPQPELVAQTGASAFEHLTTPLWGAVGEDADGELVQLGLIAGALVNHRDIGRGLFTPDVTFPSGVLAPDECVFFSRLPQALSTEAEMMTRYVPGGVPDGRTACLQRIHVTGGTNGILVDSLRRFRPFTPGFIGRAEDQAYLLSALDAPGGRLGYLHAAGLIMRHDKERFAQEAMALAKAGKEVGDDVRILLFSAYARALGPGVDGVKAIADPFTGCFVSRLPATVALLRFALRVASLTAQGRHAAAAELSRVGVPQLREALEFTGGEPSRLHRAYERERLGWQLFYDSLADIERGLGVHEAWAGSARDAARRIVAGCRVGGRA
ncbi:MAG: hypothetical protein R6V57_11650 [Vicinamibacterales bacterium]